MAQAQVLSKEQQEVADKVSIPLGWEKPNPTINIYPPSYVNPTFPKSISSVDMIPFPFPQSNQFNSMVSQVKYNTKNQHGSGYYRNALIDDLPIKMYPKPIFTKPVLAMKGSGITDIWADNRYNPSSNQFNSAVTQSRKK